MHTQQIKSPTKIVDYTVIRMLSIYSTATGYMIKSYRKSQEFGNSNFRIYNNITASSMRRFYRLSKNDIDFQLNKGMGYQDHNRMFPWER